MTKLDRLALLLKQGRTYDYEDFRTTARLRVAGRILRDLNVRPVGQTNDGKPVWDEWVTNEVFNLAARLADEVQTKRGQHERRKAAEVIR